MDPARSRRLWEADQAEVVEDSLDDVRDLLHVVPGRTLRRIEVDHDVVGFLRIVDTREPGMDLDRGVVRHPYKGRHVVGEDVRVLRLEWIRPALDPLGREAGLVLLIEVGAVDAVGKRLQRERPVAKPGHQVRRDLGVVPDEICLGVTILGEEDLLEVRQLDAFALDLQNRRDACTLVAVVRRGAGRRRRALGGLLRLSRRLAPLLTRRITRIDVLAKAAIGRMPERAVARDLRILDLADELRQAPSRRLIRPRLRRERRRR